MVEVIRPTTAPRALRELLSAYPGSLIERHEPTFWLRGRVAEVANWPAGCGHLSTVAGEAEPVVVAPLWAGRVYCLRCVHVAGLRSEPLADRVCDRCGRVCATPLGDLIYPCAAVAGGALVLMGLCRSCRDREVVS